MAQNSCLLLAVNDTKLFGIICGFQHNEIINIWKQLFVFLVFHNHYSEWLRDGKFNYGSVDCQSDKTLFSISSQHLFRGAMLKKLFLFIFSFIWSFFLDLLKCIYCQIIVSAYMITYCFPVIVCSQKSFFSFFFFWQALLVLHYYRACVALGV